MASVPESQVVGLPADLNAARIGMGVLWPRSGSYFQPSGQRAFSTGTPTANVEAAHLVMLGKKITLSSLSINVTTAGDASSVIRLGVRADNGDLYPGVLLQDLGTTSTASTGTKTINATNLSIGPGPVWFTGTPQVITSGAVFTNAQLSDNYSYLFGDIDPNPGWIFLGTTAQGQNTLASYWLQSGVSGALPATFSTTLTPGGGTQTSAPLIVGKAA